MWDLRVIVARQGKDVAGRTALRQAKFPWVPTARYLYVDRV